MKKWIAASLIVLVLVVAYTLLPAEIAVHQRATIKVNSNSAYRILANQNNWAGWWPQQHTSDKVEAAYAFDQYRYQLQQSFFQSFVINVHGGNRQINSTLTFMPLGIDYTIFDWKAVVQGSLWQKIQTFFTARRIQGQMEDILDSLKAYMEKDENIYGIKVRFTKVTDTTLVATKFTTTSYPQTNEIYQYISILKAYINSQSATATNCPMLHVQQLDSNRFENQVAIPTNREVKVRGSISFKRMVRGNILEAEVRGGPATAQQAMEQLGYFREDHQLPSPAIPFMSLVTDRSKERDTTKWITKIYYPVY